MSTGPDNLFQLACALRDAVGAEFAADGVALPARREVVGSQVVADCEKLAVTYERVFTGVPAAAEALQQVNRGFTRSATLNVFIFRCVWVPDGVGEELLEPPDVDVLDAEALVLMTDANELHRAIYRAHFDGAFQGYCSGLALGPVVPIVADGGMGGNTVQLLAELS